MTEQFAFKESGEIAAMFTAINGLAARGAQPVHRPGNTVLLFGFAGDQTVTGARAPFLRSRNIVSINGSRDDPGLFVFKALELFSRFPSGAALIVGARRLCNCPRVPASVARCSFLRLASAILVLEIGGELGRFGFLSEADATSLVGSRFQVFLQTFYGCFPERSVLPRTATRFC